MREGSMTRRSSVLVAAALLLAALGPGCDEENSVTAPELSATCSAQPASGTAPLAVSFLVGVSGAEGPFSVNVSYGDGATGTDPGASHTYTSPGDFIVAFNVTTATQSARCSTSVSVQSGGTPPPGTNQPPKAVFKTQPDARGGTISGTAPFSVRFNMCPSADPEGDKIFFTMDFENDGNIDQGGTTGGNCRRDHVYAAGTWSADNCLHDVDAKGKALHEDQCTTYSVVVAP
jgi:hypothetical protein